MFRALLEFSWRSIELTAFWDMSLKVFRCQTGWKTEGDRKIIVREEQCFLNLEAFGSSHAFFLGNMKPGAHLSDYWKVSLPMARSLELDDL